MGFEQKTLSERNIKEQYGEEARSNLNVDNYCFRMSKIIYNKKELFDVVLIPWKDVQDAKFEIFYKTLNGSCDLD